MVESDGAWTVSLSMAIVGSWRRSISSQELHRGASYRRGLVTCLID